VRGKQIGNLFADGSLATDSTAKDKIMNCASLFRRLAAVGLLSLSCTGCSTLGLSLFPTGATLTTEAEAVLNASQVPREIPRENAKTVLMPHALQPGDAVLIEPLNMESDLRLPADQTVLADGTIDLGPYGRVIVAGRDWSRRKH
jgi:hypothetical protein